MRRKNDDTLLILAGAGAAILLGATASSSWVWLRQGSNETARAHRKRATRFTTVSFGVAGALGAAAAAALLGPRIVRNTDWNHMMEQISDSIADLRKQARKADLPRLEIADLRKRLDRLAG